MAIPGLWWNKSSNDWIITLSKVEVTITLSKIEVTVTQCETEVTVTLSEVEVTVTLSLKYSTNIQKGNDRNLVCNHNQGHLERSRKVLDSARTDQLSLSSNQSVIGSEVEVTVTLSEVEGLNTKVAMFRCLSGSQRPTCKHFDEIGMKVRYNIAQFDRAG